MATDMFLKLGDIKGESKDQVHRDEIEISKWGWGMSQTGSMHTGSGGGAGKVNIENLSHLRFMDKSSPNLMMGCSTGKPLPRGQAGGAQGCRQQCRGVSGDHDEGGHGHLVPDRCGNDRRHID
ncbi:hypothetical cytosolic protein [Enterocytozoon bieneusi H348]|nr:hypothetical cytosolic protein [Enterocytozoon bieneusi H348]|eukprot:XP_002651124.1 hypothetical cytosolic protein [Enterocytozoon bieneusi H348]